MLTAKYIRNQRVVKKFYPHWNEEEVRALARVLWPLDEALWPLNKIVDLLECANGHVRIATEDDDELLEIETAVCFLETIADERSVLTNHNYPIWRDPFYSKGTRGELQ